MNVIVIDYGMSNLGSIRRALEETGKDVFISDNPESLNTATHIVLPGVGAFKDGIKNLRKRKFDVKLKNIVVKKKVPLLGICLGMQLLADFGFEGGKTEGLGFISGSVKLFKSCDDAEKIPHIGWNDVLSTRHNPLLTGIPKKTDFYFVHSYHFIPENRKNIIGITPYCGTFVSAVMKDNIFGVQFHPEKSQYWGFKVLSNFIKFNAKNEC
jgi:glutamine amidotransferase